MQDQNKRHHPLDLNTLKGHGDSVTGLCFSSDARSLATGKKKKKSSYFVQLYVYVWLLIFTIHSALLELELWVESLCWYFMVTLLLGRCLLCVKCGWYGGRGMVEILIVWKISVIELEILFFRLLSECRGGGRGGWDVFYSKYLICLTKEGIFNTYSFLYIHTACADGVVRIFKLDDASSKSFKYESQVTLMQYQILPMLPVYSCFSSQFL